MIIVDTLDLSISTIKHTTQQLSQYFNASSIPIPPILAIVHTGSLFKHTIYKLGIQDYLSYPTIAEELIYRVYQASSKPFTICHKAAQLCSNSVTTSESELKLIERTTSFLIPRLTQDITLKALTKKVGTNRNKLNYAFKSYFGATVFVWLREQRMKKAAELLESSELNITQISEQVGYPDSNNFSTAFKKVFHLSPLQYRINQQQNMHEAKKPVRRLKAKRHLNT
ncbi:helix-turn-helix domain-containing protein [Pseudoalteromonas umbrosa]|uniref:helix-turn-helix domain-containing protein n=1 Tax=Pseudoalteromonas umbrosa TaxID=3048489 RepID=UPI0024C3A682|nr:AraC family transcriptional regulator [Pseudoalteromonas sp. B95]MDK1285746.1 AraC family transcriptional regulator [Pseudoalteromonas sp. B95]